MHRTNTCPTIPLLVIPLLLIIASCSVDDIAEPAGEERIWEKIHGPKTGTIEELTEGPGGAVYAAMQRGGIFRSSDGGATWLNVHEDLPMPYCIAHGAGDLLYKGTGFGVYVSGDGGESWALVTGTYWKWRIFELAADDTGSLLAAGSSTNPSDFYYIGCSHDNGETWMRCHPDTAQHWYRAVFIAPGGDLFAGTNDGDLFRSEDGGAGWTRVGDGVVSGSILHITAGSSGVIHACGAGGIFRSEDGGTTWEIVTGSGVPAAVIQIAFGPDGSLYACCTDGVYRSDDGGETWEQRTSGMHNSNARALIALEDGALLCGTVRGSIFRSTDAGETWSQVNETGMDSRFIGVVALGPDGAIFTGTDNNGLFRSLDRGSTWMNFDVGPKSNSIYDLAVRDDGRLFAATGNIADSSVDPVYGGVYRSTDGGWTWEHCGLDHSAVRCIQVAPNRDIYASASIGFFRSTDNGDTWQEINIGRRTIYPVRDIAITVGGDVYISVYTDILRSIDGGGTWERMFRGLEEYGRQYEALAATEGGCIFVAAGDGGIYRSTDRGESWEHVYDRGETHLALSITAGPRDAVAAGSENNFIIFSNDGGDTWQEIHMSGPFIDTHHPDHICFDESGRLLATVSRQVLVRSRVPVL